jgi:protein required for attachment to host cells
MTTSCSVENAMSDTWILVADSARARLFSLGAGATRLEEIGDFINAAARTPGHELEHAQPSRVHDRLGYSRHAIDARTPPRMKAAAQFAEVLKAALERGHADLRFRNLVLIAPPRFLGVLNGTLGARLCEMVVLRVSKNLTRRPANEIGEALPRRLFKRRAVAIV